MLILTLYCSKIPVTRRRVSILEYETIQPANTTIWEPSTTTEMITTTTEIQTTTIPIVSSTTESSGPGVTNPGNTTILAPPTTPGSCACIPWWPCWCNPCWNMPCHNCNGCMG